MRPLQVVERRPPIDVDAEAPPRPRLPPPVALATSTVFRAIASLRRGRALHPLGLSFAATVTLDDDAPLAAVPGPHAALVRFSRGAGLREPLPDVNGLAVKLPDAHGPGRDQDVLLVTSGRGAVSRHLILPTLGYTGRPLSSVLTYRYDGKLVVLGAEPVGEWRSPARLAQLPALAAARVLRYRLTLAPVLGPARPIGTLVVGDPLPPTEAEALTFDPWHTGPALRPAGPLNALRAAAYVAGDA